ncbi:chemotaxis protein CheW [Methylobacterium sp. J-090]|uniref:chemotaxis protein CheW n=1 Tax=Methylobacterium sp. J-090 TaxID=2836666 RepID=UPI001FBB0FEA|nr:chemotaxis protein CheW [Methylobacterium sp. J-090]MCJ2079933.1 chemotaxis protein CheW [Methylobacterium sp. J-090]
MNRAAEIARRRGLREARTRALAGRDGAAQHQAPLRPFLVCTCGEDRYGLPLTQVAQVLAARSVTPVPGAPAALLGVIALSGRVVSLLGLARALGRTDATEPGAGHIVVLRGGAAMVALAVDRVEGVAAVAVPDPDSPASGTGLLAPAATGLGAEAVSGYAPAQAGAGDGPGFVVVDLPRLLRRYLS